MPASERFIDTSMLVRYFTDDIPEQAEIAETIIERERLLLTSVIILECGYVLTRIYGYARADVVDALLEFLRRPTIQLVDLPKEHVLAMLARCRDSGRLSFGNALIVAAMLARGATEIYAFDRRLEGPGIRVLGAR